MTTKMFFILLIYWFDSAFFINMNNHQKVELDKLFYTS